MTDLISGQVQVMSVSTAASKDYVKAGTLAALAVTSLTRLEELPDIPTVGELLPGYEAVQWYGIGAPRNTPADVIDRLNKEINAALADLNAANNIQARLIGTSGVVMGSNRTRNHAGSMTSR